MDPSNWLPFHPDLLPRRRRRLGEALASLPPYTTAVFPVSDVLAGLTFLPYYPDRVPHLRVTREQMAVMTGATLVTAIAPQSWLPIFPGWGARTRLPLGAQVSYTGPPLGYAAVVAASLAWQAGFPSAVPHRLPPKPAGLFWAIDPSIPAAAAICLDLGLDVFATSTLLTETGTAPALIVEGLASPRLLDEDLC
jgi:hypothetical protein